MLVLAVVVLVVPVALLTVVLELKRGGKRPKGAAEAKPTEALVEYEGLFDEPEGGEGGQAEGGAAAMPRLREWVPVASLRPPPSPPDAGWHKQLSMGTEAAVLHDGGWWDVLVRSRLPGNVRLGEPTKYVVEAVGYGVKRTVAATEVRPRVA